MELLQDNFLLLSERFAAYREWLTSAEARISPSALARDEEWRKEAEQATSELLEHAPTAPSFDAGERPQPEPALQIAPRV